MQALRLNEVLMRVVAWHNRHPLARRITASQVHSVGEVVLPFASAQPAPAMPSPQAAPAVPALHDLLDPPASEPIGLTAPADIASGTVTDTAPPDALPAPETHPGSPPPEVPSAAAQASLAEPAGLTEPNFDEAPGLPDEDLQATEPEPEPVLSMEEEADKLFSSDDPPADGPPDQAPDTALEAPDSDGPELLIEQTDDPDAPADTPPAMATEADSAELAAAFAAATADRVGAPLDPATAEAGPADPALSMALPDAEAPPALVTGDVQAPAAAPAHHAPAALAPAGPAPTAALAAAPASAAGWRARLRAWLQALRPGRAGHGLPKLKATFSRDFIWPLRPAQVAGWSRRHGSLQTLAPLDWPQRLIDTDPRLQAQARGQGLPHDLPLHVLTAAIGVGDRRIRVLIDAQGHILGPRAYSPPKLAALASVVALGLVGAGWGGLPRADSLSAKQASAAVAAAASAAAQAASAAALAAAAASAAESVWLAQRAEAGLTDPAPAEAHGAGAPQEGLDGHGPAGSPSAASAPAADPDPGPGPAHTAAPASHTAAAGDDAAAAPHAPEPAEAADTAPQPRSATTIAKATLGQVLPALSPADRQVARQQALALRGDKAAAAAAAVAARPPTKVYAVVSQRTLDKQSAARSLGLMRASNRRLGDEAPAHGELMQDQGAWRAAWWPFENQADAERARVILAARGVPCEVVEF